MTATLPSYLDPVPDPPADDSVTGRLAGLLASAHAVWSAPEERRRLRAFGFRPAVERGVLKREWHGLRVRVSAKELRLIHPDGDELRLVAPRSAPVSILEGATGDGDGRPPGERPVLLHNGVPPTPAEVETPLVRATLDLVAAYERWVEAREGRRERLERAARHAEADRRPVNALAETRRLQRLLQTPRRRGASPP